MMSTSVSTSKKQVNRGVFTPSVTIFEYLNITEIDGGPYKKAGPLLPVSIWEPLGGRGVVRVRVDMPGVNKVVVTRDVYENVIRFKGFEEEITMHGITINNNDKDGQRICRVYEGFIDLDPVRFPVLDFTYLLSNGVLWFKITSHRPATSKHLGVVLQQKKVEAAESEITRHKAINPLVFQGLERHSIHHLNEKAFVLAVDMPGIGDLDTVTVNMSEGTIHFHAEENSAAPVCYGESAEEKRRVYEGYFRVHVDEFEPGLAQFEINHGVFWIVVPRLVMPPVKELVKLFRGDLHESLYG